MQPDTVETAVSIEQLPLSYSEWSIETLISREKHLTAQLHDQQLIIDKAETSDIQFLLQQEKLYSRLGALFSLTSKIIGGAGPIALVITTALNAASYSNYIIAGISAAAVPLYQLAEQLHRQSATYNKQALMIFNDNAIDLQKVKAARKANQAEQSRKAKRLQSRNASNGGPR